MQKTLVWRSQKEREKTFVDDVQRNTEREFLLSDSLTAESGTRH